MIQIGFAMFFGFGLKIGKGGGWKKGIGISG
jgi:hypothetical protein